MREDTSQQQAASLASRRPLHLASRRGPKRQEHAYSRAGSDDDPTTRSTNQTRTTIHASQSDSTPSNDKPSEEHQQASEPSKNQWHRATNRCVCACPLALPLPLLLLLGLLLCHAPRHQVEAALSLPDGIENILGFVPTSNFQCQRDGYFGDTENDCRLFHLCQRTVSTSGKTEWRHWTYACGNQTMFNQLTLTCAFMDEAIPCKHASQFQYLNEVIHRPKEPFLTDADVTSGFSYYSNRIMSDGARARALEDSSLMAQLGGASHLAAASALTAHQPPSNELDGAGEPMGAHFGPEPSTSGQPSANQHQALNSLSPNHNQHQFDAMAPVASSNQPESTAGNPSQHFSLLPPTSQFGSGERPELRTNSPTPLDSSSFNFAISTNHQFGAPTPLVSVLQAHGHLAQPAPYSSHQSQYEAPILGGSLFSEHAPPPPPPQLTTPPPTSSGPQWPTNGGFDEKAAMATTSANSNSDSNPSEKPNDNHDPAAPLTTTTTSSTTSAIPIPIGETPTTTTTTTTTSQSSSSQSSPAPSSTLTPLPETTPTSSSSTGAGQTSSPAASSSLTLSTELPPPQPRLASLPGARQSSHKRDRFATGRLQVPSSSGSGHAQQHRRRQATTSSIGSQQPAAAVRRQQQQQRASGVHSGANLASFESTRLSKRQHDSKDVPAIVMRPTSPAPIASSTARVTTGPPTTTAALTSHSNSSSTTSNQNQNQTTTSHRSLSSHNPSNRSTSAHLASGGHRQSAGAPPKFESILLATSRRRL